MLSLVCVVHAAYPHARAHALMCHTDRCRAIDFVDAVSNAEVAKSRAILHKVRNHHFVACCVMHAVTQAQRAHVLPSLGVWFGHNMPTHRDRVL